MNLIKEFKDYSRIISERNKKKMLSTISFKFSVVMTNIMMAINYNKRRLKLDENAFINIGAGNTSFEGVSNTDLFPSIGQLLKFQLKRNSNKNNIYYLNILKEEKHFINNWEGVILSHVIEHLPPAQLIFSLNLINKYLKKNGIVRILVPNPKIYLEENTKEISPQGFCNNIISLNRLFYSWGHQFMFSESILIELLRESGFKNISITRFGEGPLGEFDVSERKYESLCVVAVK